MKTRPRVSDLAPAPLDRSVPHHGGYLFIRGIPRSTKQAFKAACASVIPPVTMRDAVIRFMRDYSKKNLPKAKQVK